MGRPSLRYGAASRPIPGEHANGDQWIVQPHANGLRVAVIDGLGHGPVAEAAAVAAVQALRTRPDLTPSEALLSCDLALRGTRGAAASVLWLEPTRAVFAGVGNVDGRVVSGGTGDRRFSPDRGVLGRGIRAPRELEFPLAGNWVALLHSDGIRSRFDAAALEDEAGLETLAELLLTTWARRTDDATIVVVRNGQTDPRALVG